MNARMLGASAHVYFLFKFAGMRFVIIAQNEPGNLSIMRTD